MSKDQSASRKRKREPLVNVCYALVSGGSIEGPSRNGLNWCIQETSLMLANHLFPGWKEGLLIDHITQNRTQEISFSSLVESNITREAWIEAAKAATGVTIFRFNFSQITAWLSAVTRHENFLKELMTAAPDVNNLSLSLDKKLEVSWQDWRQILIKIIASLPTKVTTIRVYKNAFPPLTADQFFTELEKNFGRIDNALEGCAFEIDIPRFKQLHNKNFISLLAGLHTRTGARSFLRTLALRHSLFERGLFRTIAKSAGVDWKSKAGLLGWTQPAVDDSKPTTQNAL